MRCALLQQLYSSTCCASDWIDRQLPMEACSSQVRDSLPPRVGLWSDADMSNAIVVLSSPRTPDGAESVAAVTSLPLHSAQSCFSVRETDCGEQGAAIGFSMAAAVYAVYSHRLPFLRTNAPCPRSRQSFLADETLNFTLTVLYTFSNPHRIDSFQTCGFYHDRILYVFEQYHFDSTLWK